MLRKIVEEGLKSILWIIISALTLSSFLALSPLLLFDNNEGGGIPAIELTSSQIDTLVNSGAQSNNVGLTAGEWVAYSAFQMDDGVVWLGGAFNGTITLGDYKVTSEGSRDGIIASLSPEGEWVMVTSIAGSGIDEILNIQFIGSEKILVKGLFNERIELDNEVVNGSGGWGRNAFEATFSINAAEWSNAIRIPNEWISSSGSVWCGWQ